MILRLLPLIDTFDLLLNLLGHLLAELGLLHHALRIIVMRV